MLLALVMDYEADQPPPLLELHRTARGGLFDRLLDNLEVIAANAEGPLITLGQLDRSRTNNDDEIDEDGTEPPEQDRGSAAGPSTLAVSVDDPALPDQHEPSQRRWPRRAN